jgi:hypothetical protein
MWMLAYFVATMVVSYLITQAMTPKPIEPAAATFADFDFPQADEGTPKAVVFGDYWCSDWTILALGNYSTSPIRKDGGGK